ncbi:glycoside hydrolase family 3 C-terminal domain-containing protein [Ruminococcus sp.]|uniref:glycoside hydrolase family 3 C-terminal domain-containing protein n=1 Tax=Ruminococcus sp. TaxID=41978 RepID=UPI002622B564|nr:glycoside hydrolase family 3 C-terminal domain-containing protein [Ruminococcus sp.]MDD7556648.1 glycoside hydrolase family 3 C-terminal domain-containing protein [Ruminococcus sp.]MDY4964130.1 glycoside hydrolase family 3 C-terminal domain-containing protein [Ruminococcus callidus]
MERYLDPSLTPEERAEDLTDRLTVEEQASQLRYDAPPVPRLGIPAYNWWNEGLHGVARAGTATLFPQAIGMAATFDPALLHRIGEITAVEARAKHTAAAEHGDFDIYKGLTLWAPNINLFRDPRWGRGHETYGEDPFLTARLGVAFVQGMQGDGPILRAAACAKHFAVHSGPESVRHSFDAKVSPKDLEESYLPAFRALVTEARVEGVMGAYNRVNGEPACASPMLMDKLREWGFDGYFVSDCWAIRDFHQSHGVTRTVTESAALALRSGCDLNCGNTYMYMLAALEEGLIDPADIRRACIRVLRTRIRLGLFDPKPQFPEYTYDVIACPEHKAEALSCAEKSMVLLKNDGILPLDASRLRSVAVIGPNGDSRTALEGNYCGTADRYITFLEGIQDAFPGRVYYAQGCHLYRDRTSQLALEDDRYAEALAAAEAADVVIACLGLDATLEGEEGDTGNEFSSGDKQDLRLPQSQRKLLEKLHATGKPLILVLAAGSALNPEIPCNAVLQAWYPGQMGGQALANILFGKVSPSGKLPVTFYETAEQLPDFTDYSMQNRTYRYVRRNVLYPFGYGLTYSRVVCTGLTYEHGCARVTVENTGDRQTEDVVQLYIKDNSPWAVPNHSLCGFARVSLEPGQSVQLEISIPDSAFESVDDQGIRAVTGTAFTLFAGTCQPDPLSQQLSGTSCVSVSVTR